MKDEFYMSNVYSVALEEQDMLATSEHILSLPVTRAGFFLQIL